MPWVYIICFALVAAGLLTLFGVRPGDFIDALFRSQRKSATLTDELNVLMGIPAKGFFNQDFELKLILSILVDTFISKISLPMQPVPEIGSISVA